MVFEALTSGAQVGLLNVPRSRNRSRVYSAIDSIRERNLVLRSGGCDQISKEYFGLAEADRVALQIISMFGF